MDCNPKIAVCYHVLSLCHLVSMFFSSLWWEIGPTLWYLNLLNILAPNYLVIHFLFFIPPAYLALLLSPSFPPHLGTRTAEERRDQPIKAQIIKEVTTMPYSIACHKADERLGKKEPSSLVPQVIMRWESGTTSIHSPGNESNESLMRMGNGTNVTHSH